ncbi:MAG: hypothetical protein HQL47_10275, partial [Gammaproteobacteria bacterium]|nr:hypothetical protein [Gammaproteobacteria bacterium]
MIVIFEVSNPFRAKPKLERFSFGWRIIWLWFSFAVWPPVTINTMHRAWLKDEL